MFRLECFSFYRTSIGDLYAARYTAIQVIIFGVLGSDLTTASGYLLYSLKNY